MSTHGHRPPPPRPPSRYAQHEHPHRRSEDLESTPPEPTPFESLGLDDPDDTGIHVLDKPAHLRTAEEAHRARVYKRNRAAEIALQRLIIKWGRRSVAAVFAVGGAIVTVLKIIEWLVHR